MASLEMARNIEPNSTLLFSEVARMHLKAAASREADRYFTRDGSDGPAEGPGDLVSEQIGRLREALRASPNHADMHYRLGLLLKNRGQLEDAAAEFREAVSINPTYMKALVKLGLSLAELDRTDEAIDVLKQAMDVHPEYVDLHYQLGLLFAQRHQFEMAVEHFEKAAAARPRNVDFQANLALALQNMGLIDRATASWQIVHDLAPDSEYAAKARLAIARAQSA
jgi:tetratricopeptide (TPR) repeat protein